MLIAATSTGFGGSIGVVPWLASMRFVMGIGIGAEVSIYSSTHRCLGLAYGAAVADAK
jgi:hypothetical protein